ncbi:MAG: VWA domain-containing protein [Deltaproteobacteria bacterium]|nr:VWA domain-containing protein [Deltaproteobacteria bacterium]
MRKAKISTGHKNTGVLIKQGLAGKVARFADFLKAHGFNVFQSSVHDAVRGLIKIDISKREDILAALRANFATNNLEWSLFEDLFDEFQHQIQLTEDTPQTELPLKREAQKELPDLEVFSDAKTERASEIEIEEKKEWLEGVAYSPVSTIEKKDLARFDKADIRLAQLALKKIIKTFKIHTSRRYKGKKRSGKIDLARILRQSLKTGGIPLKLFFREKKKRLKRLVIIADVSGSMDRYFRFVIPFLLGLRGVGSRAEVFAFSTSLTSITFMLRHMDIEEAITHISLEVPDWSGGTRIGYSLHQFSEKFGRKLLNQRTIIIILSDGWDLGGKELLKREMEKLNRKAKIVIWLNPLAGEPGYQPMCKGMKIALPHVDYFLPANSLESLIRVGRLLSKVMIY